MGCLKKVKYYLYMLKIRNASVKLDPITFEWKNQPSVDEEALIESVLPEESLSLTLYQKYSWEMKEPKSKYSYLFSEPEYEWKLVSTFCSRFVYDEYEKSGEEKLVATPYEAITEEQYQALLASEARKKGRRNR